MFSKFCLLIWMNVFFNTYCVDVTMLNVDLIAKLAGSRNENDTLPSCYIESSIDDFPDDLFTAEQRLQGALVLHFLAAIYFFTLLAVICNDYFLPSVECICVDLNISKDVAAATFMATATTTPELFTNLISTFVADSDMGIGTIIGSLMFNTLGVAALAGLAATKAVQLDWWPITRDCFLFGVNIIVLVIFAWDSMITLTESIILIILYFCYFIILFNNNRIIKCVDYCVKKVNCKKSASINPAVVPEKDTQNTQNVNLQRSSTAIIHCDSVMHNSGNNDKKEIYTNTIIDDSIVVSSMKSTPGSPSSPPSSLQSSSPSPPPPPPPIYTIQSSKVELIEPNTIDLTLEVKKKKNRKSLWRLPVNGTYFRICWWYYTWPIKFILTFTIPNPKTWRKLYPLTFIMCVIFIGLNSYLIVWMLTIIGDTFSIPESLMGLTFLAAGGCMPEAISSVLMIRKGEGGIGVSNSLGANSLAILLSLGLPWLIRNIMHRGDPLLSYIELRSFGIEYTILSLLLATIVLYAVISVVKYQLKKKVGVVLMLIYIVFITICILMELDIIFPTVTCIR